MRNKRWAWLAVAALAGMLVAADGPAAVIEKVPTKGADGKTRPCQRDWTNQVITVVGQGPVPTNESSAAKAKMMAKRVAYVDGYRLLAETIAGVHVTSETTVKNYELVSDDIHTKVDSVVQGAQVLEEGLDADGIYHVKMCVGMFGAGNSVAAVVVPAMPQVEEPARRQQQQVDQAAGKPPIPAMELPAAPPAAPALPERKPGPYTGLVVDARGFELEPAMSPKIVKRDGSEVWGTLQVDPQFVLATGIVSWVTNLEDASKRAGDNPIYVRAVGRHGSFRCDPVIEDDEAAFVLQENAKNKFMDTFHVAFVR